MASSASTSLRMELMVQLENDGTWGDKLKTSLQILDSAIAGTTAISTTGGDTTLTNVDYTNDQAKKAVLDVTGALVSNANIIIPNASRVYRVFNRTSGAFTVGIKTASGSAITVTQGTVCEVYCDGSNTMYYVTPMADFTTGAPATESGAAASSVSVTPAGDLGSTNAQDALEELQADIDAIELDLTTNYQPLDADLTAIAALSRAKGTIIVGGASAWGAQSVGTDGHALIAKSGATNGVAWSSLIPAATDTVFYEASAPTGWTSVSSADYALRTGTTGGSTGGSTAFTSVFTSRTIAQANLPNVTLSVTGTTSTDGSHTHTYARPSGEGDRFSGTGVWNANFSATGTTGSDGSHSHTVSGTTAALGSATAMDFAVRYYDVIICSKDAY